MKVLVVDESEQNRDYFAEVVKSEGHSVAVAEDGVQGLRIFDDFAPDLVLAEVEMPGRSGLELLESLRRDNPGPIIVLISANCHTDYRRRAFALGADAYFLKPIPLRNLQSLLKTCNGLVKRRLAKQRSNSLLGQVPLAAGPQQTGVAQ